MDISTFLSLFWLQIITFVVFVAGAFMYNNLEQKDRRFYKRFLSSLFVVFIWIELAPFIHGYAYNWIMYTILFMTLYFEWGFVYMEKYNNAGQVIADGCHGSWCTTPREVGPFTIFNAGTSNSTYTRDEGDFVIIAPTIFIDWEGPKAYINCQLTKRELNRLPIPLQVFLRSQEHKYNIYDIRYGMFSREQLQSRVRAKISRDNAQNLLLKDFEERFLNSETEKGVLQEHVEGITTSFEKQGQHLDILGKFGKKKNIPFISPPDQDKDQLPE